MLKLMDDTSCLAEWPIQDVAQIDFTNHQLLVTAD